MLTPGVLSKELRDELVGELALARFCAGTAKLCTPPAYREKALELAGFPRRGGDLALPSLDVEPNIGDFDRVADENGDVEEANASKPERFRGVKVNEEPDGSFGLIMNGETGVAAGFIGGRGGGDVALLDENMFCPLTAANGELEDAYAMNPPCVFELKQIRKGSGYITY